MMGIDGLVQWVSVDDGYRWVGLMGGVWVGDGWVSMGYLV